MIRTDIICVGKIKEKYLEDAIREYSKRLGAYVNLDIIEVKDEETPEKASEKEIAGILETKESTVRSYLHRGRQKLKRWLENEEV